MKIPHPLAAPGGLILALCTCVLLQPPAAMGAAPPSGIGPGYTGSGSTTNNPYDASDLCVPDEYTCCAAPAESGDEAEECNEDGFGMPVWRVTEPLLNLWLVDRPLWYRPSRGPVMAFELFFKNIQGTNGMLDNGNPAIFGVGTNWHTRWRSYVKPVSGSSTEATVFLGNGSARTYTLDQVDYNTRMKLTDASPGYILTAPNGAVWRFTTSVTLNGTTYWFLNTREDASGQAIQFSYFVNADQVQLTDIVGPEGATITFDYISAGPYPNLISAVHGPGSRTASLSYDGDGRLTNIVDMGGLATGFFYDATNNLRQMTTPYGTSTFTTWATATNWSAIKVAEVGLRTNFWLYLDNDAGARLPVHYAGQSPTLAAGLSHSWDTNDSHLRNSFHWNQRRIEQLADNLRTNLLNDAFEPDNVVSNDFQLARQRHWLATASTVVGRTLSFERAPTPNGSESGQITWYDHAGKPANTNWLEGTQQLPRCVGWKLPDASSRHTYFNRNGLGHPTVTFETYSSGALLRSNRFEYAANEVDLTRHIRFVAGGAQRIVTSNTFNASHQILSSRNALEEITEFTYDGSNRLVSISRPSGHFTTNVYGADGRLAQVIDREGATGTGLRTNAFTWTNDVILTHTDARGAVSTNTIDAFGRVTQVRDGRGAVSFTYDKLDLIRTVDRMGHTRSNLFDALRRPIRRTDARANTTRYVYCSCGSLDYVTNALGQVTHFAYDHQGRLTTTFHPGGYNVTNHWNAMGELVKLSDNGGHRITNSYNEQGLLVAADTAGGRLFSRTYDIEDNLVSATDANGVTTTNAFDALRRLTARGLATTNSVETLAWTSRGLLYAVNPLGRGVTNALDALGRKIAETNANGEVVQYAYKPAGDLVTLTDGKAQVTTWAHDDFGRVTNKADHLGTNVFIYRYDANNRLTNRWTPGSNPAVGINTRYVVDANGNVTLIDYPNNADLTLAYDALNRLTNMVDGLGTTRYGYTVAGLLASEDGPWDSDTVSYEYTTGRQRSKLTLLQPNASSWEQTYAYDLARRLTNTTSPAGVFRYEYATTAGSTPGRLIRKLTLGNGAYITNAFDDVARLISTTLKNSSHIPLNSHAYEVNSGHQRTRQTRFDGSFVDYGYDPIGQLTSASGKENGGGTNRLHEQLGYDYDAAGNLNYRTNNAFVQTFNVNSLNELTTISRNTNFTLAGFTTTAATNVTVNAAAATRYADHTFTKDNLALVDGNNTFTAVAQDSAGRADTNALTLNLPVSVTLAYDLNGNLRTNGTRLFDFDDENQLTRITQPGSWKSEFTYDGRLRRRIEKNYEWRGGAWVQTNEVRFVYDGNVPLQERDGFNVATLTLTRGLDLSGTRQRAGGIGGLLALSENSKLNTGATDAHAYYHADGNGNVTGLLDGSQQIAVRYIFDPYGNSLGGTCIKAHCNRYRFSSKPVHELSGVYDFLRRWYMPDLQRWVNRDVFQEMGGLNMLMFALNEPVGRIDAWGLESDLNKPWLEIVGAALRQTSIGIDGIVPAAGSNGFPTGETGAKLELTSSPSPGFKVSCAVSVTAPNGSLDCKPNIKLIAAIPKGPILKPTITFKPENPDSGEWMLTAPIEWPIKVNPTFTLTPSIIINQPIDSNDDASYQLNAQATLLLLDRRMRLLFNVSFDEDDGVLRYGPSFSYSF